MDEDGFRRFNMSKVLPALVIASGATLFALPASAAVVCNDEGDCWKTTERLTYPPDVHLQVYGDDYVIDKQKFRWREAGNGRGYWRRGVWIGF
jgi:hypothetical protein